ncbi:hypothetical protein [Flavobacterium sp. ENC]|uniref:hypothetical protein n=1 Tax=Flavobacterium sp. ENC TaxID=2897330 RepID=UPI001E3A4457|nr:hypothetical protein [Flavobacterium sp. ENC]MCD0466804.1 hypothetical protein [Flavobacterium sp. ENC]
MKKKLLGLFVGLLICTACTSQDYDDDDSFITQRITDNQDSHQGFTDLVFFDNQFFLVFRESSSHAYGTDGIVKLYSKGSDDKWTFVREFKVDGFDLRDPKFSIHENNLMLYIHGTTFEGKKVVGFTDYNSSYSVDKGWNELQDVKLDNLKSGAEKLKGNEAWPWRVTWYKNVAYSVGYNYSGIFDLYNSDNGLFFKSTNSFSNIPKMPTEATLRVNNEGQFYILARRNYGNAIIGRSNISLTDWDWFSEIPILNFGGPNFLLTGNNNMLISGRENDQLVLGEYDMAEKTYNRLLTLKSGGDCGYAGMVRKDNFLWISYYSSHECAKGSSIYIAKINLDKLKGYKE